jgi:hypothetical protein
MIFDPVSSAESSVLFLYVSRCLFREVPEPGAAAANIKVVYQFPRSVTDSRYRRDYHSIQSRFFKNASVSAQDSAAASRL